MKWLKFRIKTTEEAEDIIISSLYDIGLEGAQVEDKAPLSSLDKERMFVDIPPEYEEDDGVAYLSFFVEETKDGKGLMPDGRVLSEEEILSDIEAELSDLKSFGINLGEASVESSVTEDLDWVNNWKQYFQQFTVEDVRVVPSWEEPPEGFPEKYLLRIDPGTAFGTGAHETTQLCIRALEKYMIPGAKILDVGTGSGILSILSLMFGAGCAMGTDLDPCAIAAVADNKERNGIPEKDFTLLIGNLISDRATQKTVGFDVYDIAVANILADVLVPLAEPVAAALKEDGIFITSGIIEGKEGVVKEAMEKAGITVLEETAQGEWRCVVGRKEKKISDV